MRYLLDTNHWSLLQRRDPRLLAKIQSLPDDATLYMPVIAQAELLGGVEITSEGKRKAELRRLYEQAVAECAEILIVDSPVAEQFALVLAQLKRDGRPIGTNDMWIAAIALVHDLTVASNDAHLSHVRGLRVEDWTQPQESDQS